MVFPSFTERSGPFLAFENCDGAERGGGERFNRQNTAPNTPQHMHTHTRVFSRCGISTAVGCIFLSVVLRNNSTTITEHVRELHFFAPKGNRIVCCCSGSNVCTKAAVVQQRPPSCAFKIHHDVLASPQQIQADRDRNLPLLRGTPLPITYKRYVCVSKIWLHSSTKHGVLSCVIRQLHLRRLSASVLAFSRSSCHPGS